MPKFKILVVSPFTKDAHSFWRCMGPLTYLAKSSDGDIGIGVHVDGDPSWPELSWDEVSQYDLVFLHRPCRPVDIAAIKIARALGIPVWCDFDDWLFDLPPWNANETYNNIEVQTLMAHALATCDIVTTTTSALYNKLVQINKNVIIVPNAYRSDLYPYRAKNSPPRKPIFAWRGSNTHDGDLMSVFDAWTLLPAKVHFLGSPSWNVISSMTKEKYQVLSHQDPFMFFKYLYTLAPKVMLFPLANHFFNACKSNIAYIEAMHAGSLIIAPDMPEWQRPGVVTYEPGNAKAFKDAAELALSLDSPAFEQQADLGYENMRELYDISIVNRIRQSICQSIVDKNYTPNNRDPYDQLTGLWALSKMKEIKMVEVSAESLQKRNLE